MSMCSFFLLKGFDFQELFGQIVAVTPSFHQLILSQQICSSLVERKTESKFGFEIQEVPFGE